MNYINSLAGYWATTTVVICLFILRMRIHGPYRMEKRPVLIGDLLMTFSLILFFVEVSTLTYTCVIRVGNPSVLFSTTVLNLGCWVHITFYVAGIFTIKFVFISLYYGMIGHMTKATSRAIYAVGGLCIIFGLMNAFLQISWCHFKLWHYKPGNPEPELCCVDFELVPAAILTGSNLTTDVLIVALGMHIVSQLQMTSRQKIALVFIVSIGVIPLAMTSLRFSQIYKSTVTHEISNDTSDTMVLFTVLDWGFAMMTACLPALRVYLRRTTRSEGSRPRVTGASGRFFSRQDRKKLDDSSLLEQTNVMDDGEELLVLKKPQAAITSQPFGDNESRNASNTSV